MLNNANDTELANNITNIGLSCKGHGVNKVFISSILVWQNPKLYSIIRRVNDQLGELCKKTFFSVNNNMITTNHFWRNDIHLPDIGTNMLSRSSYQNFF